MLGEGDPAVVSVNGIMASLGVTELLMHITAYRSVNSFLVYDGRAFPYGGLRVYVETENGSRDRLCPKVAG